MNTEINSELKCKWIYHSQTATQRANELTRRFYLQLEAHSRKITQDCDIKMMRDFHHFVWSDILLSYYINTN